MREDRPQALPRHRPLRKRLRLRHRKPIGGEGRRIRAGEFLPGIRQILRLVRRRSGRSGSGRGVRAAADEPARAVGRAGGAEGEARAAGEARGAQRGGAGCDTGGVRIEWGAVHGRYHVDAPPSDPPDQGLPLRFFLLWAPQISTFRFIYCIFNSPKYRFCLQID